MALTKETVTDKIEVLENGTLQVRSATRVLEDGEVLSSSFHRHVLAPGDDTTNEDAKVVAIATATWTADVVTAYNDVVAAQVAALA
jgi:archaellum component FlaF (FlaF/FlaG flagellin family)